jgi:hypothetical protein
MSDTTTTDAIAVVSLTWERAGHGEYTAHLGPYVAFVIRQLPPWVKRRSHWSWRVYEDESGRRLVEGREPDVYAAKRAVVADLETRFSKNA